MHFLASLKQDLLSTSLFAALGRAVGFFIPFVIAAVYGTSRETDAFFLVYAVILWAQMILTQLYETVLVPFTVRGVQQSRDISKLIGGILGRSTVFLTLLSFAAVLGFKPLISTAASFDSKTLALAFLLFLEMIPAAIFTAWAGIFNGTLNAHRRFVVPALSPGIRSGIVLLGIWLVKPFAGIQALSLSYFLGEGIRALFSFSFFRKNIGKVSCRWDLVPEAADFFKSGWLQMVGFSILCSLSVFNQALASRTSVGALSIYAYGEKLRNAPVLFFFAGILPVLLSHWSHQEHGGSKRLEGTSKRKVMGGVFALATAVAVLLILFRSELVHLAFGRGQFPAEKLPLVADIFALLVGGLPFDVLGLMSIHLLIIHQKNFVYVGIALARVALTLALSLYLIPRVGIRGIAASTTLVNIVVATSLFVYVQKFIRRPSGKIENIGSSPWGI